MFKKFFYSFTILGLLFLGLSRLLRIGDGGLEIAASYVIYPFLSAQKALHTRWAAWHFDRQTPQELAKELERYHGLHEKLQQEVIQLKSLMNYKDSTQDMRDFLSRYKTDCAIISQILLKNFGKSHFYLIDAGSVKGVTKDMIAVYKDCLVGRVIEVYPRYSKLVLITDPACKVAAVTTPPTDWTSRIAAITAATQRAVDSGASQLPTDGSMLPHEQKSSIPGSSGAQPNLPTAAHSGLHQQELIRGVGFVAAPMVKGIHEGILKLDTTRLSFVHQPDELKEGDMVISSGEGLVFPKGFGLGCIRNWQRDGYNCVVDLQPLLDLKKLEYVCLVKYNVILEEPANLPVVQET